MDPKILRLAWILNGLLVLAAVAMYVAVERGLDPAAAMRILCAGLALLAIGGWIHLIRTEPRPPAPRRKHGLRGWCGVRR